MYKVALPSPVPLTCVQDLILAHLDFCRCLYYSLYPSLSLHDRQRRDSENNKSPSCFNTFHQLLIA